ncbi:MAG: M48 family metallopeptidase [Oligoflexia bacterium]|nr:M48 family metallopeptidase [Oligoflexia bacterium]
MNLRRSAQFSTEPPLEFRAQIDRATFAKSLAYTRAKGKFAIWSGRFSSVCVLIFILTGILGELDRQIAALGFSPNICGVILVLTLTVITEALSAPLAFYSTFRIEAAFGFNRMTAALWFKDLVKHLILSCFLLTPVVYAVLWFMASSGAWWWLYAGAGVAAFQVFVAFIFPNVLAPIFNKFSPLEPGELKTEILQLASRANFRTSGVYVMDGSRRSAHANAYFAGLGTSKRIVLFDTLIKQLSTPEISAVLAHEIGHQKCGHIWKGLLLSALLILAGFRAMDALVSYAPMYEAFGFAGPSARAALVILIFLSAPIGYFISPLFSSISRRFEYQADRFAVGLAGGWENLAGALIALSKHSLSNLVPHPLYSFFHYSHPALAERIAAMKG